MNYLDLLKTIYLKEKVAECDDIGFCISLTKTLGKDKNNLEELSKIIPFLFYIEPKQYFYLLYFLIKPRNYIPKTIKFDKQKEDDFEDIKRIFGWSNREIRFNKSILERLELI